DLLPYAEYALTGNGKHLRPALVALTASAIGKPTDAHVTVAVIIEMVHLATLVHDDIMDEAAIRRGRLTLAANWGNEIAVLFGDCVDLFGSEAAAGKSLGTDLAKGKLTLPVLLLIERTNREERKELEDLVQDWQAGSINRLNGLLNKYDTLSASLEVLHQYL